MKNLIVSAFFEYILLRAANDNNSAFAEADWAYLEEREKEYLKGKRRN